MKKIIALALSAVMMLSMFTACSSESTVDTNSKSADIVVIGAGGAGMSAAIQAVQNGATNVVIVEKTAAGSCRWAAHKRSWFCRCTEASGFP